MHAVGRGRGCKRVKRRRERGVGERDMERKRKIERERHGESERARKKAGAREKETARETVRERTPTSHPLQGSILNF